jgi:hypothetical protein
VDLFFPPPFLVCFIIDTFLFSSQDTQSYIFHAQVRRTCCTSIPRASKSVVMSTRLEPLLNSRIMSSRPFWSMSPCCNHQHTYRENVSTRTCQKYNTDKKTGVRENGIFFSVRVKFVHFSSALRTFELADSIAVLVQTHAWCAFCP